jgi:hypothetical protein
MKLLRDVSRVTFSRKYMYAIFRFPKCRYEQDFPVAEYHSLNMPGKTNPCSCSHDNWKELRRRAKGTTIEIDQRCEACGKEWSKVIEWYRPIADLLAGFKME